VADECAALQRADPCPAGQFDLILEPRQLTLQIHESVGHPLELDRVLGGEANYAGTSFATTAQLGTLRYGSDEVTLTADASLPRGVATFGYDDEGVAGQRWTLVDRGTLAGYLTSREYAGTIGEQRSRGAMRAEGWTHAPIVRMVNISLEPGPDALSLDELIADTPHGILMDTNRSWSIDQRRVNFQFGCEVAWEIRDGKLGRMLRNPVYHGLTTEFWGSCDAVCDARAWQLWGIANCGKGQPGQTAEMSHGSSPARFRGVACGAT
jgi:TldD protein